MRYSYYGTNEGAYLILAAEEGLPRVHLDQDAAEAPDVNGQVVGDA